MKLEDRQAFYGNNKKAVKNKIVVNQKDIKVGSSFWAFMNLFTIKGQVLMLIFIFFLFTMISF